MAPAQQLLAGSLEFLKLLHDSGQFVFAADRLPRIHRDRLLKAGYLQRILRGWYLSASPADRDGDTTAWQANWQAFLAQYCEARFGAQWQLSAEQSLHVQTATPLPSRQLLVHAAGAHNNVTPLLHGWSILEIKGRALVPESERLLRDGLRLVSIPYALTQVSEAFFHRQPAAAQIALTLLPDAGDLGRILLTAGKPVVGGRLVAALQAAGRHRDATLLHDTLSAAGYRVHRVDPFDRPLAHLGPAVKRSPYVLRLHQMWAAMRGEVVAAFAAPPGRAKNRAAYLSDIEARYAADAYNSLSIEGYNVTPELIARVRAGAWNRASEADKHSRDALAAKGYSLAHAQVKLTIGLILKGDNPGDAVRAALPDWYRALWTPSVQAGILKPEDLAGYRNSPVYIRNADHVPPPRAAVRDCMPALFDLLEGEEHAAVRAVLGHYLFVFIHPYPDGNGRLGRFIMNAMLASGGYPWTVIALQQRTIYFDALNQASGKGNIVPFAKFLGKLVSAQSAERYRPVRAKN